MRKLLFLLLALLPALAFADSQEVNVQVKFSVDTPQGVYTDALYFKSADYAALSQKDIDQMKQDRVTKWQESVKNAPVQVETKEQVEAEIASVQSYLSERQSKLSEMTAK